MLNLPNQPYRNQGFTVIELLITTSIIGILAAITVPSLMFQRIAASHVSTAVGLKTLATAQTDYFNNVSVGIAPYYKPFYTDSLAVLGASDPIAIDSLLAGGRRQSYDYTMDAQPLDSNGMNAMWSAEAHPMIYRNTGILSFYIDEQGVIRAEDVGGGAGDLLMPLYE